MTNHIDTFEDRKAARRARQLAARSNRPTTETIQVTAADIRADDFIEKAHSFQGIQGVRYMTHVASVEVHHDVYRVKGRRGSSLPAIAVFTKTGGRTFLLPLDMPVTVRRAIEA